MKKLEHGKRYILEGTLRNELVNGREYRSYQFKQDKQSDTVYVHRSIWTAGAVACGVCLAKWEFNRKDSAKFSLTN